MGEKLRNYSYVTARLIDPKSGVAIDDVRQGVYLATLKDRTILVAGESGEVYHCASDASEIPDKNLFGDTKQFVQTLRELNR